VATAKTIIGSGFGGALNYSLYGRKDEIGFDEKGDKVLRGEIIGGTMAGESRKELMSEFSKVRELRPNIQKPVAHHIFTFAPEDKPKLDNETMSQITAAYMKKKGYSESAAWVAIRHTDKAHDHVHIIASTIEMSGKAVFLAKTNDIKICRELEKTHGLRRVENTRKEKRNLTRQEQGMKERGATVVREELQREISQSLEEKKTATVFAKDLREKGIFIKPNLQKSGKVAGISFAKADDKGKVISFKGSKLGDGYKWSEIEKKIDYAPARDFTAFLAAKQEAEKAEKGLIYEPERDSRVVEAANAKTPITEKPEVEKIPILDAAEAKAKHTAQLINIAYAGRIGEKTLEVIEARLSRGDKDAPQIAFKENVFDWHTTQSRAEDFVNMSAYIAREQEPIAIWRSNLRDNCAASYLVGKLTSAALEIENRSLPTDFQKTLKNAFVESANHEPSEKQLDTVKKTAEKLGVETPNLPTSLEAMTYLAMNKTPAELNKLSKGFEQHFKENPPRQTEQDRPRRSMRLR
jgi:hypothetical protein